jgi:hypothetical protein
MGKHIFAVSIIRDEMAAKPTYHKLVNYFKGNKEQLTKRELESLLKVLNKNTEQIIKRINEDLAQAS